MFEARKSSIKHLPMSANSLSYQPNQRTFAAEFMRIFGPVFEHSPWIAEATAS